MPSVGEIPEHHWEHVDFRNQMRRIGEDVEGGLAIERAFHEELPAMLSEVAAADRAEVEKLFDRETLIPVIVTTDDLRELETSIALSEEKPRSLRRKIMRRLTDGVRPKDETLAHTTPWYQGRHSRGDRTKRVEMVVAPSADDPHIPVVVGVEVKPGRQSGLLKPKPRADEMRAAETLAEDAREVTTYEPDDGVYHFSGRPYEEDREEPDVLVMGHEELAPTLDIGEIQLTLAQTALLAAANEIDPSAQHIDVLSPVLAASGVHIVDLASDSYRQAI